MTAYTLFGQSTSGTPGSVQNDAEAFTLSVQFSCSQSGTVTGIWWFSAASATVLPDTIAVFAVSGRTLVHSESATWSGAAGSGWVKASFSSAPSITASASYKAAVLSAAPSGNWYSKTDNYWTSGSGSGGITSGPLTAPNNAGGDGGQDTYNFSGTLTYPLSSFNASNYWVDPEVTTAGTNNGTATITGGGTVASAVVQDVVAAPAGAGGLGGNTAYGAGPYGAGLYGGTGGSGVPATIITSATFTGAGTVSAGTSLPGAAAFVGAGTLTAAAGGGTTINGTAALTGAGSLTGLAVQGAVAALTGAGSLTASPGSFINGTAALTGAGSLTAVGGFAGAPNLAALGTLSAAVVQQAVAVISGLGVYGQAGTHRAASKSAVTDPRDGTPAVTHRAASMSGVS